MTSHIIMFLEIMKFIETFTESQIKEVHSLYLNEWWTNKRTLEQTKLSINNSQVCIGLVDNDEKLAGFARVLSDFVFKGLIFDVIVSSNHRSTGSGKAIMAYILNHPKLQKVRHFELYCLEEMMPFYEKFGFTTNISNVKLMRLINE